MTSMPRNAECQLNERPSVPELLASGQESHDTHPKDGAGEPGMDASISPTSQPTRKSL
jgi:hypothetical protein